MKLISNLECTHETWCHIYVSSCHVFRLVSMYEETCIHLMLLYVVFVLTWICGMIPNIYLGELLMSLCRFFTPHFESCVSIFYVTIFLILFYKCKVRLKLRVCTWNMISYMYLLTMCLDCCTCMKKHTFILCYSCHFCVNKDRR